MAAAKQFPTSFLSLSGAVSAIRARFTPAVQTEVAVDPRPTKFDEVHQDKLDAARLARLQDHELERRLFTQVEREDSEMLNRVRSALYAD